VVVLPAEWVGEGASLVGRTARPCRFAAGGERRQDSVERGLEAMPEGPALILVHDAARPFADRSLIDRVIAAAAEHGAAVPAVRVGTGYDLHRLVEGRPLVLAGVPVPFDRGPLGHSDGDVLCHAITDAVLGAAAAGDIGQHFSNTDPQWKDAPGLVLLHRAM